MCVPGAEGPSMQGRDGGGSRALKKNATMLYTASPGLPGHPAVGCYTCQTVDYVFKQGPRGHWVHLQALPRPLHPLMRSTVTLASASWLPALNEFDVSTLGSYIVFAAYKVCSDIICKVMSFVHCFSMFQTFST